MTTPEYGSLRSDDDHWDIVSNVGYTALLVAGWRALHTTGPKPLVQDEYAKHFITSPGCAPKPDRNLGCWPPYQDGY